MFGQLQVHAAKLYIPVLATAPFFMTRRDMPAGVP